MRGLHLAIMANFPCHYGNNKRPGKNEGINGVVCYEKERHDLIQEEGSMRSLTTWITAEEVHGPFDFPDQYGALSQTPRGPFFHLPFSGI